MCTVSFVRSNDTVIITSNRDEHLQRVNAFAPGVYEINHKRIIYPKDAKAGGTWFVATEDSVVAVLLNGAFESHVSKPPYRKSRGLILLEIIEARDAYAFFKAMNLENIEPFTLVLFWPGNLYEFRWDGFKKHELRLNDHENYIWASATLYDADAINMREQLFGEFLSINPVPAPMAVQQFHSDNHGDNENGFVINRQTGMLTFSITQAAITDKGISFIHNDLLQHKKFEEYMPVKRSTIISK